MKHYYRHVLSLALTLLLLQSSRLPGYHGQSGTPTQLTVAALGAQRVGRSNLVADGIQTMLRQFPFTQQGQQARYAQAEAAFVGQDWPAAIAQLERFLQDNPGQPLLGRALMLLARSYESLGQHEQAATVYLRYEAAGGPLAPYAAIRRAAQLEALGRREEAAAAYELGAGSPIAPEQRALAYEAAVRLRDDLSQPAQALENLQHILGFAQRPAYRRQLLLDAARRAQTLGDFDQAANHLREIVDRHPDSGQALEALDLLAALGQGADPLAAARALFLHQRYSAALSLFDAALGTPRTPEQQAEARYMRALAIRALGDLPGAAAELWALANEQPDSRFGRQARLAAIQTRGWAGDVAGAIASYRDFAQRWPDDPLAPEALERVAILIEQSGDPAAVTQAQLELGRSFPRSRQGQDTLARLGMAAMRESDYQLALEAWRLLGEHNSGETRAQGLYWAGRITNDLGDADGASALLGAAYEAAPDSYYGVRAAELLSITQTAGLELGRPLSSTLRQVGMLWIASWHSPDTRVELDSLPELQRARELQAVYLKPEADQEWAAGRELFAQQPATLFELALHAHDLGNDRAAMRMAEALVASTPAHAAPVPVAVRRLLYPTPFAEAVQQESASFGVDPALVYAVMRQESRFDPRATSWVGARGLMQVMPTTGAGIAANLGVAPFSPDDLYHAQTSIRFGAYYIAAQVRNMSGSLHAALSAYNGGPGNAVRWAGGNSVGDPDLFMLNIDFRETRHYVEVVYANYGAYKRLYSN